MNIYLPNPPIEDTNEAIFKEVCAQFGLDKITYPFQTEEIKNYITQQMKSWELQAQIRDGRIK
ncbi:hypothetical protein RVIR1_09200 [Candidatus Rickettsiella viridis]|uniref:Uncharacterized protein n=1 Tax=Candidatus Rickettsiella viridis TaxID=676208 RepID=A0A2Z5UWT2_9COXI|nr:hypothetical protein RVIR1_09200 [Candidatus Rickettsiella viridis]